MRKTNVCQVSQLLQGHTSFNAKIRWEPSKQPLFLTLVFIEDAGKPTNMGTWDKSIGKELRKTAQEDKSNLKKMQKSGRNELRLQVSP